MKSYGTDPFGAGKAKDLALKIKLPEKVVKNLIETDKIRAERFEKRFGKQFQSWKKICKHLGIMLGEQLNLD